MHTSPPVPAAHVPSCPLTHRAWWAQAGVGPPLSSSLGVHGVTPHCPASPGAQSLLHARTGSVPDLESQQTQDKGASLALWHGSGHAKHRLGCSLALALSILTLTSSAGTIPRTLPGGSGHISGSCEPADAKGPQLMGLSKKKGHCMGLTVSGPSQGRPVQLTATTVHRGCLMLLAQRLGTVGSG